MELKFLKKKKKFIKGGTGIKPDLYWRYIVFFTFMLIILFFAFGLYFFIKIDNKLIPLNTNVGEQEGIKKERIDKALEYFTERENKSIEILKSSSPIVDPSL